MPWCKVTISYGATGYTQNYKRHIGAHDHGGSAAFNVAALADATVKVNASLPRGHVPNPVTQNLLGISSQGDQIANDPGPTWRLI